MRRLALSLGVSLVCFAACEKADRSLCSSTAYRAGYLDAGAWTQTQQSRCGVVSRCGHLAYIDCGAAVDGPAYYVDERAQCVLETCGGACMGPSADGCVACPPPEWTCAR